MRHERRYVGDPKPSVGQITNLHYANNVYPDSSMSKHNELDKDLAGGKSPQEIWEEAFLAGSEYGYNYNRLTLFPDNDWSFGCRNNTKQKAIKLNPYHSLNELED